MSVNLVEFVTSDPQYPMGKPIILEFLVDPTLIVSPTDQIVMYELYSNGAKSRPTDLLKGVLHAGLRVDTDRWRLEFSGHYWPRRMSPDVKYEWVYRRVLGPYGENQVYARSHPFSLV